MADDAANTVKPLPPPPLPPNYVSFLDLRDRWMKLHPQPQPTPQEHLLPDQDDDDDDAQPVAVVLQEDDAVPHAEGEGFGEQIQPSIEAQEDEKSGVHSNPKPKYPTRTIPFHGNRRQSDNKNVQRWVQVSHPNPLSPPLEAPAEIQGSDKVEKKENVRKKNKKRNQKKQELLAPNEEKVEADPSGVEKTKGKRKNRKKKKAEDAKKDVVVVEEKGEDGLRAEIEGGIAGISLSGAPEESSSRRSMASRNPRGWRKDGGYGRFEQRVLLKKERAKKEGGLVWVKKGESTSTDIVAAPMENEGDVRV